MTRHPTMVAVALTLACLFGASGCPDASEDGGPTDTCESAGQQCRLGGGQLGVCTPDADGELECAPQH